VAWVDNGREAFDVVDDDPVAVVILDLSLPDMDGLDVCRALRADGYTGGIMMLTGRAVELDIVVGLDTGADDYLPKPFGLAELRLTNKEFGVLRVFPRSGARSCRAAGSCRRCGTRTGTAPPRPSTSPSAGCAPARGGPAARPHRGRPRRRSPARAGPSTRTDRQAVTGAALVRTR
jgi:CheY-like chemotaxis protein